MTNLVIVASNFHIVESVPAEQDTFPASIAITAGSWCIVDATGKWALANATTAALAGLVRRAIAVKTVAAGQALTCIYRGVVDPRGALDALAFGAAVYLSDTVGGIMGDVAGTVPTVLGTVIPGWGAGATPDKLMRIA